MASVYKKRRRTKHVLSKCKFAMIGDLSASAVLNCLSALREEGASAQTSNHYLRAIKQFARWLVLDRRTPENPLSHLAMFNVEVDRRRQRRPLTVDEFDRLIRAAESGPVVMGLPGPDRAILYAIAAYTGYRRGEIASIRATSFDFTVDPPTLTVRAGHSKRRRTDVMPLRQDLVRRIRDWMEGRETTLDQPLFRVSKRRTADMLKADLKRADIPYVDSRGRYADFHALRHTFVSNLGKAGVSPKLAQSLARHSDINLTMNAYSHLELEEQFQAVNNLPPLPLSKSSTPSVPRVVPTGAQNGAQHLSPRGTSLSSNDTPTRRGHWSTNSEKAPSKPFDSKTIDTERRSSSSFSRRRGGAERGGFEPPVGLPRLRFSKPVPRFPKDRPCNKIQIRCRLSYRRAYRKRSKMTPICAPSSRRGRRWPTP